MPKHFTVKVNTLDAEIEFSITSSTLGKQLFEQVTKTINIREVWWFGLQYEDTKGLSTWLAASKKVVSQDVPNTKEGGPLCFRLRPRFYPEDATEELIQSQTLRLFYLHVRESILTEQIYCPPDTCVLLASFACQIKFGDYTVGIEVKLASERLLPARVIDQHNLKPIDWVNKIVHWYKDLVGTLVEDAYQEYLKIAQDLEQYGVNFFEIKNKKGTQLYLGVDALGVNFYDLNDKLTPKIGMPWSEIKNVTFSDKKFTITAVDKTSQALIFTSLHVRINKRILVLCMGNHELYLRRRNEDPIEVQQMKQEQKSKMENARSERDHRILLKHKVESMASELQQKQEEADKAYAEKKKIEKKYRSLQEMNAELEQGIAQREKRISELEELLRKEKQMKHQLEELQMQIQLNNEALLEDKNRTEEESRKLRQANAAIQKEIDDKNEEMHEIILKQQEIERQNEEVRKLELELNAQKQAMMSLQAAQQLSSKSNRSSIGTSVSAGPPQDFSVGTTDYDDTDGTAEFDNAAPGKNNRNEENRETAIEKDVSLKQKLNALRSELSDTANVDKMDPIDRIHAENKRQGRNKFKTLKQIRQGNTKKRIDEFEGM